MGMNEEKIIALLHSRGERVTYMWNRVGWCGTKHKSMDALVCIANNHKGDLCVYRNVNIVLCDPGFIRVYERRARGFGFGLRFEGHISDVVFILGDDMEPIFDGRVSSLVQKSLMER